MGRCSALESCGGGGGGALVGPGRSFLRAVRLRLAAFLISVPVWIFSSLWDCFLASRGRSGLFLGIASPELMRFFLTGNKKERL